MTKPTEALTVDELDEWVEWWDGNKTLNKHGKEIFAKVIAAARAHLEGLDEAATALEALRKEYAELISAVVKEHDALTAAEAENERLEGSRDEWEACAKHYVAENERLREALMKIEVRARCTCGCRTIASAALKGEG